MAGPGQTGFNALGEILTGEVNPSAKMVDTYVYDLTQTPTWNNFGSMFYDNMDEFAVDGAVPSFVNYVEGIYVGYKFYETANLSGGGLQGWQIAAIAIDVVVGVILVVGAVMIIKKSKKMEDASTQA